MQKTLTNENLDFEARFRRVPVNFFLKLSGYFQVSYPKGLGNSVWSQGGFKKWPIFVAGPLILSGAICLPRKIKNDCFQSCSTGGLSVSTEGVCRFQQEIVE